MTDAAIDRFVISRFTGLPVFRAEDELEHQMLEEAGLDADAGILRSRPSPTTFHVASRGGVPIAAAVSTTGRLAEVPLGLALAQAGVEISDLEPLPSPVSELVSLSEDRAVATAGATDALYRSFYHQARAQGAASLVVGIDPWVHDVLLEQYGIPFQVLGPVLDLLGRELLPVGGRIADLEAGLAVNSPEFFEFMQQIDEPAPSA